MFTRKTIEGLVSRMFYTLNDGSDGAPGAMVEEDVSQPETIEIKGEEIPSTVTDEPAIDLNTYIGSKDVNPEQKPLRVFDRDGLTKEDIDEFIAETGEELFLSHEEIAALADKEKEAADKTDDKGDKGPENKEGKDTEGDKEEKDKVETDEEFDEEDFLKVTGLTKEGFAGVPEEAQDKIIELYQSKGNADVLQSEQYIELKSRQDKLTGDVKNLLSDPVVSARVEELNTGERYVARDLPPITNDEINRLKQAETVEVFETELNRMIESRAKEAISRERIIRDRDDMNVRENIKASGVMAKVAAMDKRLGGEVDIDNWDDMNPDHPQYKKFMKGEKKIVDFCTKNGLKNTNISKMSPKALYAAIAADEGWTKQKEDKIAQSSVKKFLKSIREGHTQAKSVSQGKRSGSSKSKMRLSTDESYDSMVEKLASGDTAYRESFRRLLDAADGDPKRLDFLESVQMAAEKRFLENQNTK